MDGIIPTKNCIKSLRHMVGVLVWHCVEVIIWAQNYMAPFLDAIGALAGPISPALGMGASVLRHVIDAGTSGTAVAGDSAKEVIDAYGRLDSLLSIIRAQNSGSAIPYRMREDDYARMKDLFCTSGHLMPPERELCIEFLRAYSRAGARWHQMSAILEKMHKSAESGYEALKK